MALLRRGVDLTVIALWLGHESTETTQMYLHADMQIKERALAHATPSGVTPKRFWPTDPLLAFLEASDYAVGPAIRIRSSCVEGGLAGERGIIGQAALSR